MSRQATLCALRVEDFAIVEKLDLNLSPGLNVLTGETGAGKSVLVSALSLLLGGRASSDLVRAGRERAIVEALVSLDTDAARALFTDVGVDLGEDEVVVRRVIARNGRGRVTVNGQMITVSMLSQLMSQLFDMSGQHEHVALLDPEKHLEMVDAYAGHVDLVDKAREAHERVAELEVELERTRLDASERAKREDYLRFQLDEIEQIEPLPDELESLRDERDRLRNAGRLEATAAAAESMLYSGDGAVVEVLGRVHQDLQALAALDSALAASAEGAGRAVVELEDLARELGRYARSVEAAPDRLEDIDDRLEAIGRLCRKHGGTIEEVLERQKDMARELEGLVNDEARRTELESEIRAARGRRQTAAVRLTRARKRAATALQKSAMAELASLSMKDTRVELRLIPLEEPGPRGAERAELLIAPNPGEPLMPLARTASGGELSRVLLALKVVLADRHGVSTYVFDEIDSGIGGKTADVLGKKLKTVSLSHQVLVVTHLPQVAAYGDTHFFVEKSEVGGRTASAVRRLSEADVVDELARMLGGTDVSNRTRELALEMRGRAGGAKKARSRGPGRGTRRAARTVEHAVSG